MAASKDIALAKCSFCGKSENDVLQLVSSEKAYICDECVNICVEIIEETKQKTVTNAP